MAVSRIPSVAQNGTDHEASAAWAIGDMMAVSMPSSTFRKNHKTEYQGKVDDGRDEQSPCG